MEAIGSVISVVEGLSAAIESPVFKEISSIFSYRSELHNLHNTVSTVKAVLLDAQAKEQHELSNAARSYIDRLKYAVYDADDLLDKFTTLAHQKQQLEGGKFSKEVRAFFSHLNQLGVAYTMSRGIKEIRKTLDAITSDHSRYGIGLATCSLYNEPIVRRNKETCSWVNEKDIVGRDNDKKVVIDMLLDPNVEENVSFVKIVGIGGLGKTALAQLVYNDKVIESAFPDMRMWVCVSDQDPKRLDIKAVLCKILESATKKRCEGFQLDLVQNELRKALEGKKYLLVLDDVWIEDRNQCIELGGYLMSGQKGSQILVTTRSKKVAQVIGNGLPPYELQGLSKDDSWNLFKRLAFQQSQADPDPDLVKIGEEIVKECANVPLAIRMMGTLLYGKSKMEWLAIQRKTMAKIAKDDSDITHVLKLSYYHLDTRLKSCFSYCAVFPKDYKMNKMKLISLWMAQGYLEPLDESQSLINVGEECFSFLLGRCFFQDVGTDYYGEIVSCKMHDLMHDIAQEVAGNEICNAYSITSNINNHVRHVFAVKLEYEESSFPSTKIRTYLKDWHWRPLSVNALLRNWKNLRALDLLYLGIEDLPSEIGKLLHLRYLDLSSNSLERLPKEITKLYNLQTLLLSYCSRLKELTGDVSKLVKLNVLDIEGCSSLRYMPCGLDKLSGLCILPLFVVGDVKSSKKKQGVGRLEDIATIDDLQGRLMIKIFSYVKGNDKGGFLKKKKYLNEVDLIWLQDKNDENNVVSDKALAEELQPNPSLKQLQVRGYRDVEMPSWAIDDKLQTSLPNLVKLCFGGCEWLEDLPMLGRLQFLKSLVIKDMEKLKYMEKGSSSRYGGDGASSGEGFFNSLQVLELRDLPEMKGWWKGDGCKGDNDDGDERSNMSISFPHLCQLHIQNCPLLTTVPFCPAIEKLYLWNFNERLKIMNEKEIKSGLEDGEVDTQPPKLRDVFTDDVGYLKSLPIPSAFQSLSTLWIQFDDKVNNLREVEDVFRSCSSSLQSLKIIYCRKVRSISGELEHLTALQDLRLLIHSDIIKDEMIRCRLEEEDVVPWSALQYCLDYLEINYVPRGIRHLSSLNTLILADINHVKTIPEWFTCLSSLRVLNMWECSQELHQRCKSPDGLDWPKIQHISDICIRELEEEEGS